MSTEHQKYSTENQGKEIRRYADKHGISIVRTYADEGKSGLTFKGRRAFKRLIDDVQGGDVDFSDILVYDVSRWGRFQDGDEGGAYEFLCRQAGIEVRYCGEHFDNDGSFGSNVQKGVMRILAGAHSRMLSQKVFAGHKNLIERGYRQGGRAGFGMRRILLDQTGAIKGVLRAGEHKSLQTDRVILVPGPASEVEIVRWIYTAFTQNNKNEIEIAATLNDRGIRTNRDQLWSAAAVRQILTNEKYIGNNVWNRSSAKLKQQRVKNSPDAWIRADGAFEPLVDERTFAAAASIMAARSRSLSDDQLLAALRQVWVRHGHLTTQIIRAADGAPAVGTYANRFGTLRRAYQLIGFHQASFEHAETNRAVAQVSSDVRRETIDGIEAIGGCITRDPSGGLLTINREFTAIIVVMPCRLTSAGYTRWHARFDRLPSHDVTVAVRMAPANRERLDYYLLPATARSVDSILFQQHNGLERDAYRSVTLDPPFALASRVPIGKLTP